MQFGMTAFTADTFRRWLRRYLKSRTKQKSLSTTQMVSNMTNAAILFSLRRASAGASTLAWRSHGFRYVDIMGSSDVSNLSGYDCCKTRSQSSGVRRRVVWHEYGTAYRLVRTRHKSCSFKVVCFQSAKRAGVSTTLKTLQVNVGKLRGSEQKDSLKLASTTCLKRSYWKGRRSILKTLQCRVLVVAPVPGTVSAASPNWSLIYLHQFSNTATSYADFPHYFGGCNAAVRVVLPTAPLREQTCFANWNVWSDRSQEWKRIKFHSWFDYLTDHGGKAENQIDLATLLETRRLIHGIIDREVRRVGDPRRVIIGGASQGCCTALDAAYTYPQVLGGVIGIVGHLLGSTPLDADKCSLPVRLFHEVNDKEMNWKWVRGTVQRLKDGGFNVISRRERDPAGCGHWIQSIEGVWIRSALRQLTGMT
jgi:phospholipase/carboxylesterase